MAQYFAWKRPLSAVPYPNVWLKFTAKLKNSDISVNYRVQDLPEDRFEDAIAFMKEIYIAGEPLAQSIGKQSEQTAFKHGNFDILFTTQMVQQIRPLLMITIACGACRWLNGCRWPFLKKIPTKYWA